MINTEREGVSVVQNIVYRELKWFFREQTVDDYGIDAQIEITNQEYPTGKMIAVQIKSGESYFISTTEDGIIFRFDEKHKKYWLGHVLPVIVLLYHPVSQECIWEVIDKFTVEQVSDTRYKIVIPKENKFGLCTKEKLLILAYSQNIRELAEEIDDLDVDTESVFVMLDDEQKKIFLKARIIVDKKNASSDRMPFKDKREELANFAGEIKWSDIENDIVIGKQFKELACRIEDFIYRYQSNTLIILGEAGIGKTTLVKMVIKAKDSKDILYINLLKYCRNVLDEMQNEYEINNSAKVVIIDGWDALIPEDRFSTWRQLVDWQNRHGIKVIITSRYMEGDIWKNAEVLKINPLSQNEAFHFLQSMSNSNFTNNEAIISLINIFNTPFMLKLLVRATSQLGIPLEEATRENVLLSFISRYSEEESSVLESIAFEMMQKNEMVITSTDGSYLKYLSGYKELFIEEGRISFQHKSFYEIFAARYIFQRIFKEVNEPEKFGIALWDVFANNICPINILNYVKFFIKHQINSNNFLVQLNYNFNYMLERGMLLNFPRGIDVFKAISNVFYVMWHITSYVNRICYGTFKPEFSKCGETNFACLINVFNKIYFSEVYLDFSYTDFSNIKLWRCNLANMNFKNSKLYHANFLGSRLDGGDFQKADLSNSILIGTDLRHANLKDAILTGANVAQCMISENSLKYFQPYKATLRHIEKLIIFMEDGTIKYSLD